MSINKKDAYKLILVIVIFVTIPLLSGCGNTMFNVGHIIGMDKSNAEKNEWFKTQINDISGEQLNGSIYYQQMKDSSIKASGSFIDLNSVVLFNKSKNEFANQIFLWQSDFDKTNGVTSYYSRSYRNHWFIYLYNCIKISGDPWMYGGRDEFIDAFEEAYGDLPDADDDDIPDIWDLNPNIHDDDTPDSSDRRGIPKIL